MKHKIFFLSLIFIFLIGVSASNACNVCNVDTSSKDAVKVSNINNSLKNIEISKTNTANKNISNTQILAAGDNERPEKLSQNDIIAASLYVDEYVANHGKLPNYVPISDYTFTIPEFMFLLSKTVEYKYEKNNALITVKYNIKNPTKPSGVDIKGKISQNDYYDFAKRVSNFLSSKGIAPNYVSTPLGNMQYQTTVFTLVKILQQKNFPSHISVNIKKTNQLNKFIPKYTRTVVKPSKPINDDYKGESLSNYLLSTKNCQVNDTIVKSLALNITSKYTTLYQKAEAIFNYVNNNISYSFYYNTKYGAKNTISKKAGNCVDKSHLMVALCRSINIPARYIHGTCNFISGNSYGHVWVQVLVGNTWTAADPTHADLNRFGIINNWNTNSYTLKGIYNEVTF